MIVKLPLAASLRESEPLRVVGEEGDREVGTTKQRPSNNPQEQALSLARHLVAIDVSSQQAFDDLALLASQLCDTAMAHISLAGGDHHWIKSQVGIDHPETLHELSFCEWSMTQNEVLIVPDARLDPRFASNPLVVGTPFIRFYAGAPLRSPEGRTFGSLCVIDPETKTLNTRQQQGLEALARQVVQLFEMSQSAARLSAATATLEEAQSDLQRRSADLARIIEAQRAILGAGDDMETLLGTVAEQIAALTGATAATVELGGEESETGLSSVHVAVSRGGQTSVYIQPAATHEPAQRCREEGAMIWTGEALASAKGWNGSLPRTMVIAPLIDGRWTGFISIESQTQTFDAATLETLTAMGRFSGSLLDRAVKLYRTFTLLDERSSALAAADEIFRTFMDNNPAVSFVKDPEGRYVYANRSLLDLLGKPLAEVRERTDRELFSPDTAAELLASEALVRSSGQSRTTFVMMDDQYGKRRQWLLTEFPLAEVQGQRSIGGVAIDVTDQRETAAALRNSEERFRSVAQSAADAIVLCDSRGIITFWNGVAEKIFGYTELEAVGSPLTMLMPERYRAAHLAGMARVRETNESQLDGTRMHLAGLRKDGMEFPLELALARGRLQEEWFFTGILRDISEQSRRDRHRLAQLSLADSLAHSTDMVAGLNEGLALIINEVQADVGVAWISNDDGSMGCAAFEQGDGRFAALLWALRIAPPNAEELSSRRWTTSPSGSHALADCAEDDVRARTAHVLGAEYRLILPLLTTGGRIGALEICGRSAMVEPDVLWFALQTTYQLATFVERVRAEKDLRQNQALLAAAEAATHVGSWEFNRGTGRVLWSDEMLRIFGVERAQFSGSYRDFLSRIHPDEMDAVSRRAATSFETEITHKFEIRISRPDGAIRLLEVMTRRIDDGNDGNPRFVGTAHDVTELREAERREVGLQRQLEQVRRIDSLGKTAANVAHEFKNVLMGIAPYTELLRRRWNNDEDIVRIADQIARSIDRGTGITEEIRRFSQPVAPVRTLIDMGRKMAEVAEQATALVTAQGMKVTLSVEEEIPSILGDEEQLERVFTNLILNARDAMSEGGLLSIHVERGHVGDQYGYGVVPDPHLYVRLAFGDDGVGIAEDVLPRIFDSLFTTKSSGTGIGLALSYQIITAHDGFLFADSQPGIGTTFYIHLPIAVAKLE